MISDEGAARAVRYLEVNATPTQATALLPGYVCDAIIARARVVYPPMGDHTARLACAKLMAGRPYLADKNGVSVDKQVYLKALTQVFAAFPEWVGVNVTSDGSAFRRAHATFLPTSDELFEALTKEATRDHLAAHRANLHNREADRRRTEDEISLPPERRDAMAKRMAGLAASMRERAPQIVEPVAGKEPIDAVAVAHRRTLLQDLEARRAAKTPEDIELENKVLGRRLERQRA